MSSKKLWKTIIAVVFIVVLYSEGWKDRVKLHDVNVLTLRRGHMTKGHRSAPVPQMKCVGGSAGCSAFVPKVVQCHNKGSDGSDVQWDCKADMDNEYKFGKAAVSCEGYDNPEDNYILKGSCGLEYTVDFAGDKSEKVYRPASSHYHNNHHGNYGQRPHQNMSVFPCSISTLIMWGIIAFIVYYLYSTCSANQHMTDSTKDAFQQSTSSTPHPPYTPPEHMPEQERTTDDSTYSSPPPPYTPPNYKEKTQPTPSAHLAALIVMGNSDQGGGQTGYLYEARGNDRTGYHQDPYSTPGLFGGTTSGGNTATYKKPSPLSSKSGFEGKKRL